MCSFFPLKRDSIVWSPHFLFSSLQKNVIFLRIVRSILGRISDNKKRSPPCDNLGLLLQHGRWDDGQSSTQGTICQVYCTTLSKKVNTISPGIPALFYVIDSQMIPWIYGKVIVSLIRHLGHPVDELHRGWHQPAEEAACPYVGLEIMCLLDAECHFCTGLHLGRPFHNCRLLDGAPVNLRFTNIDFHLNTQTRTLAITYCKKISLSALLRIEKPTSIRI